MESYYGLVGDHTNPILKPLAAEVVKKHGEIELSGIPLRNPRNQCWPGGVPFVFGFEEGMHFLQRPDKITIVYDYDHQVRHVRLQLQFTVEDDGVFTMPWSATVTYRRGAVILLEQICVEDQHGIDGTNERAIPWADKRDF